MRPIKYAICVVLCSYVTLIFAQNDKSTDLSPFDFGRMWTFEEPPTDWFKEAYGMNASQAWFDDVRKSSLRFASWCSASFVSPNGLIMTNHHCSRDVAISVQNGEENFDDNGFYAKTLADERQVADLFVEQLIMVTDISEEVLAAKAKAENEADAINIERQILSEIGARYADKTGWEDLRLQTVSFYSGGKYSLYGYKKYSDIRLVLIPENDLGFYGGDPDNFTFPRYNLDCTFWRANDDDGKPLDTADNYFEFNIDGVQEGTPVFVVGNPGRTERYRTVAQLEYDRDYRYKHSQLFRKNRRDMMQNEYDILSQDPTKVREAQDLLSTINNFSNSIKAMDGIVAGLHNPEFMGRKSAMEDLIKDNSEGLKYWSELDNEYKKLVPHAWAVNLLGPSAFRGKALLLMYELEKMKSLRTQDEMDKQELTATTESIEELVTGMDISREKQMLTMLLEEIKAEIFPGDNTLARLTGGNDISSYVNDLFDSSAFLSSAKDAMSLISKDRKFDKGTDPLQKAAEILITRQREGITAFQSSNPLRKSLESRITNQAFKVFGTSLPPDATFTLRISDGVVKSYEYNGTVAPVMTTYYGMYDRHFSNGQKFPWSLPDKWANPPFELLKTPLNFISTNDIIGGNSGSAIINQNGEAVGLIFDGNIESLPGNFIFDEEYNRSVSVHAGGIYAAMKYIYKADRIMEELVPSMN